MKGDVSYFDPWVDGRGVRINIGGNIRCRYFSVLYKKKIQIKQHVIFNAFLVLKIIKFVTRGIYNFY